MDIWDGFKRDERKVGKALDGDYRCVITSAEVTVSKNDKDMILVKVRPSGQDFEVKHYIVLHNEWFNKNMTELLDAFPAIKEGSDPITWAGAMGAAKFGVDDSGYTKVKWFLNPERAKNLPEFVGSVPQAVSVTTLDDLDEEDGDLPF